MPYTVRPRRALRLRARRGLRAARRALLALSTPVPTLRERRRGAERGQGGAVVAKSVGEVGGPGLSELHPAPRTLRVRGAAGQRRSDASTPGACCGGALQR